MTQHPSLVDLSFDSSIPVGGSVLAWGISELLTPRTSNEPNLTTIHSRPLPRQERARRRGLHLGRLSARVLQRARVRPPVRLHRRALAAVLAALYVCVAGCSWAGELIYVFVHCAGPGILMMLCYSFTDLGMNSGFIITGTSPRIVHLAHRHPRSHVHPLTHPIHPDTALRNLKVSSLNPLRWFRNDAGYADEDDEDLTPAADRVPTLWWTTGLAASVVLCCAILATLFHMNVGEAILALILGFAFSFVGVQSAGTTDVNPVTAVAKVRAGSGSGGVVGEWWQRARLGFCCSHRLLTVDIGWDVCSRVPVHRRRS